jgi:hypothetical protein
MHTDNITIKQKKPSQNYWPVPLNDMSMVGVSESLDVIVKVPVVNPTDFGVNRTFRL